MASGFFGIGGQPPRDPKEFYGVVPYNAVGMDSLSPLTTFSLTRLRQTPILKLIADNPADVGHSHGSFDVSVADTLAPIKTCVGLVYNNESEQLGSCTLIANNLAVMTCHSIEGIANVRTVNVAFGHGDGLTCKTYKIASIIECFPELDYALVKIEGEPGKEHPFPRLSSSVYKAPSALLHHPKSQQLMVSIHTSDNVGLYSERLSTYHDSHYGSSGGGYIDPEGKLFAIHLGSERNQRNLNLNRLALPLATIAEQYPKSIIAGLLQGRLPQGHTYQEGEAGAPTCYLPYRCRNYLLDEEKWDPSCAIKDSEGRFSYVLDTDPPVEIEWYQAKHTKVWPGPWKGKRGSDLGLSLDDTVDLIEIIATTAPVFVPNPTPAQKKPSLYQWQIEKAIFKERGKIEIYKHFARNKIDTIAVYTGYSDISKRWGVHIYPK